MQAVFDSDSECALPNGQAGGAHRRQSLEASEMSRYDDDAIRIILIDDHGIVREGLKLIMQQTDDIIVVGEADTGRGGLQLLERVMHDPSSPIDVIVTDLGLPDISGLDVTRQAKERFPQVRVLLLTMYADDEHILGMLETGADGYLLKQSAGKELAEAIRLTASGETVLSPSVARRLMTNMRRERGKHDHISELTERERQVLTMLAEGATSKLVARSLGLSPKTVENHRARILEKLGVANTAAAISLAFRQGLIVMGVQK